MRDLRRRLSEAHGQSFDPAGERLSAFPTPEQLLALNRFAGLPEFKLRRLHGVAAGALEGRLDVSLLQRMAREEAMADLRRLDGIGPLQRPGSRCATGLADVLPTEEPKLKAVVAVLYGLSAPPVLHR